MIYVLIILMIIIIMITTYYRPKIVGYFGEKKIAALLLMLNKNEYKILHDLYLKKEDGTTSQIDHLIISLYGIFVIETKNYKGWIFGSEYSKQWTQVIYKHKSKFYNPIKQNKGHIYTLKYHLKNYKNIPIKSIIVFSTRATLKLEGIKSKVIYSINLIREIRQYKTPVINIEELKQLENHIKNICITDKKINKTHIKNIKHKKENRNNYICPKCGKKLKKELGNMVHF
ncbi:MAG: nuclease-related domain-containing protein [bacterium]